MCSLWDNNCVLVLRISFIQPKQKQIHITCIAYYKLFIIVPVLLIRLRRVLNILHCNSSISNHTRADLSWDTLITPSSLGMITAVFTTSWKPSILLNRTGFRVCGRGISAAMALWSLRHLSSHSRLHNTLSAGRLLDLAAARWSVTIGDAAGQLITSHGVFCLVKHDLYAMSSKYMSVFLSRCLCNQTIRLLNESQMHAFAMCSVDSGEYQICRTGSWTSLFFFHFIDICTSALFNCTTIYLFNWNNQFHSLC